MIKGHHLALVPWSQGVIWLDRQWRQQLVVCFSLSSCSLMSDNWLCGATNGSRNVYFYYLPPWAYTQSYVLPFQKCVLNFPGMLLSLLFPVFGTLSHKHAVAHSTFTSLGLYMSTFTSLPGLMHRVMFTPSRAFPVFRALSPSFVFFPQLIHVSPYCVHVYTCTWIDIHVHVRIYVHMQWFHSPNSPMAK